MLSDRQNNKNISQNLKNKNGSLVNFFIFLFVATFFCFYSFNNEAYFRFYFTYANKLQKQKKVDSKTKTDGDKFLLIFFVIGIAILFFFIIFWIVKKIFFPSSNADKIENYYKAIEKVNAENKNSWRRLRRELDGNELQSYIKNSFSQGEFNRSILEQFRICCYYLKDIHEHFKEMKGKVNDAIFIEKYNALKKKYNYFASFINSIKFTLNDAVYYSKGSSEINDVAEFNEKVVEFQNMYNDLSVLYLKNKNHDDVPEEVEEEDSNDNIDSCHSINGDTNYQDQNNNRNNIITKENNFFIGQPAEPKSSIISKHIKKKYDEDNNSHININNNENNDKIDNVNLGNSRQEVNNNNIYESYESEKLDNSKHTNNVLSSFSKNGNAEEAENLNNSGQENNKHDSDEIKSEEEKKEEENLDNPENTSHNNTLPQDMENREEAKLDDIKINTTQAAKKNTWMKTLKK